MSLSSRKRIVERLLRSREHRASYVSAHIKNGVAFQIRAMRDSRGWTQSKLGEEAGKPSNVISRLEDPNYGKYTLATLQEIATALDVGLLVKFVPFSRLVREYESVSPEDLTVKEITSRTEVRSLHLWASSDARDTIQAGRAGAHDSSRPPNSTSVVARSQVPQPAEQGYLFEEITAPPKEQVNKKQAASPVSRILSFGATATTPLQLVDTQPLPSKLKDAA